MKKALHSQITSTTDRLTFTVFPKLPLEIQMKIWDEAASEPQVVELVKTKKNRTDVIDLQLPAVEACACVSGTPPLLHTCHNSRTAALKKYQLYFLKELLHPIYFNSEYDTISLK
jgi:hypothetical protein